MTKVDIKERFPPLFDPRRLRERDDALDHAVAHAASDGAGTLYHVGRFDLIEFALVLEPDEALQSARRVIFPAMNAMAETIAADALPERTLRFAFPSSVIFDDGLVGGFRLASPAGTAEDEVPEWLVLAGMIRSGGLNDRGILMSDTITSLEEAGFRHIDPEGFVARFCRHLMVEIDAWRYAGFEEIGKRYLSRLETHGDAAVRRIEPNGDLVSMVKAGETPRRVFLKDALAQASWYDPHLQGPRL